WRKERGFAPYRQMLNTQFPFAVDARFLHMHVKAETAAIELRGANRNQIPNGFFYCGVLQGVAELHELFEQFRGLLYVVDALCHDCSRRWWRGRRPGWGGASHGRRPHVVIVGSNDLWR